MLSIDVENLTKDFGSFRAVDNISLKVSKGEVFGLIGPNGAGKTTTIRMLTGVLVPSSGSGMVGGFDITNEQEKIKEIIGYMSQKFSLYEDLTVCENLNFFGGIYGISAKRMKSRIEYIIKMTGLLNEIDTFVRYLPQGFKQRLALGCAILHKPTIIFLDEPTSGVDPEFRLSFWDLIREMKNEGLSVIVTTHYLDEAERADRIALMDRGRIVKEGTPIEMINNFSQKTFEIRLENLSEKYKEIRKAFKNNIIQYGEKIHLLTDGSITEIKDRLRKTGIKYLSIEKVRPRLEDIFTYRVVNLDKAR